jgi:hypothetical protein
MLRSERTGPDFALCICNGLFPRCALTLHTSVRGRGGLAVQWPRARILPACAAPVYCWFHYHPRVPSTYKHLQLLQLPLPEPAPVPVSLRLPCLAQALLRRAPLAHRIMTSSACARSLGASFRASAVSPTRLKSRTQSRLWKGPTFPTFPTASATGQPTPPAPSTSDLLFDSVSSTLPSVEP